MSSTASKMVRVRILTETHEHEDKPVPPGTVLEVSAKTATHLIQVGAAALADEPTVTPVTTSGGAD